MHITGGAHYGRVTPRIFEQPDGLAFTVLDSKHMRIPNCRLGIRTDKPPIVAPTVAALANALGIAADAGGDGPRLQCRLRRG
jgi:tricarballylate dehydrogenase